jgi:hypothetical protein
MVHRKDSVKSTSQRRNKIGSMSERCAGFHRYMLQLMKYNAAVLAEEQLPEDGRVLRNM